MATIMSWKSDFYWRWMLSKTVNELLNPLNWLNIQWNIEKFDILQ